jgi:hypothetical protein
MVATQVDRPQLAEPRPGNSSGGLNPFGEAAVNVRGIASGGGLVSVEQQRALGEVQAAMMLARANPRDPIRATESILNDCTRPTLAASATYHFARGGSAIDGPSIRLAEALAQRWGNIQYGVAEIARHDGYSEAVSYCWDMESNCRAELKFQVRHWRDTQRGGYQLTDERDIYEAIANQGARRKRACILAVIPGDVTEAAVEQCKRTLQAQADISPEGIRRLVDAFAELGVTAQQIEARIQRRLEAVRPGQVVALRSIYNSLRDGMSVAADWFEPHGADLVETSEPKTETGTEATDQPPRRRGRPPKSETAPPATDTAESENPAPRPGETFYGDQGDAERVEQGQIERERRDERPAPASRPPLQFDV